MPFCRQTPLTLKALRAKDYPETPQTLGEHLKKRRRLLGLLQREAAERMGIQRDTYVNWEKDKTKPVASQFRPVVAFLDYDPTPEAQTLASEKLGTTGVAAACGREATAVVDLPSNGKAEATMTRAETFGTPGASAT